MVAMVAVRCLGGLSLCLSLSLSDRLSLSLSLSGRLSGPPTDGSPPPFEQSTAIKAVEFSDQAWIPNGTHADTWYRLRGVVACISLCLLCLCLCLSVSVSVSVSLSLSL
eukprot:COSAG03_NODE_4490_length_1534_cov_2.217422_3_plen_108_part_01